MYCALSSATDLGTFLAPQRRMSMQKITQDKHQFLVEFLAYLPFCSQSGWTRKESLKINAPISPCPPPRLVCSLELERKQSYFIIYYHLKFLIVVNVSCTKLKGTNLPYLTAKLIAGTLQCVRLACKHMDTLRSEMKPLPQQGWACQMNYWGSDCKLTQITHSYQKETLYFFFSLKASRKKK